MNTILALLALTAIRILIPLALVLATGETIRKSQTGHPV